MNTWKNSKFWVETKDKKCSLPKNNDFGVWTKFFFFDFQGSSMPAKFMNHGKVSYWFTLLCHLFVKKWHMKYKVSWFYIPLWEPLSENIKYSKIRSNEWRETPFSVQWTNDVIEKLEMNRQRFAKHFLLIHQNSKVTTLIKRKFKWQTNMLPCKFMKQWVPVARLGTLRDIEIHPFSYHRNGCISMSQSVYCSYYYNLQKVNQFYPWTVLLCKHIIQGSW